MLESVLSHPTDTADLRKARGAFFTPPAITRFIANWAIRDPQDRLLEPSAGDAAFMVEAVRRLGELDPSPETNPVVEGVEIHAHSAQVANARVLEAGGTPRITVSDFFLVEPRQDFSAVIGNPPYIRYQDFRGESRARSRAAALKAGVALTGLASSWAAFTVHSALFLKDGGRLGLVLPAELLSVNYASVVRRFLFDRFRRVELVLFEEQVFPEAEADVVLLLAEGFNEGPTDAAIIRQVQNAEDLLSDTVGKRWAPVDPAGKWTASMVGSAALEPLAALRSAGNFTMLEQWGDTTLGMVTGNNGYFTLSPARVKELGIPRRDLLRLSPPGSTHLRGLSLSADMLTRLGAAGKSTYLFRPEGNPSPASAAYIEAGHTAGVDRAYKCRVRTPWYKVPLVKPADLMLTCMNADTARLTTNEAHAHHLNSVHGVYLKPELQDLGRELLPVASLNSATLLSAEMVGRSYGGGILKLEPREADVWFMPSATLVAERADALRSVREQVARLLQNGKLLDAVALVDQALLLNNGLLSQDELDGIRSAHHTLSERRVTRSKSGS
ncbi:N-6 DNA methylase [Paeniglutamicibacter sulfureus]|uniref:Adenine-specific DNA methylase n=1 Tax=Paeniglutamicibacter sulfureus TaxID=43666 RepID=A0ABU2BJV0_9MICC|nr:N-6 DNA methylase [Paeniglutamicibacter sulfureus]MDR7358922.1 adenine-specific DNA methylase [Paeniglutamicibacter sulfureus]